MRREGGTNDRSDEVGADDHNGDLQGDKRGRRRCRRRCRMTDRLTDLAWCAVFMQRRVGHVGQADGLTNRECKQTCDDASAPSSESFVEQVNHCNGS